MHALDVEKESRSVLAAVGSPRPAGGGVLALLLPLTSFRRCRPLCGSVASHGALARLVARPTSLARLQSEVQAGFRHPRPARAGTTKGGRGARGQGWRSRRIGRSSRLQDNGICGARINTGSQRCRAPFLAARGRSLGSLVAPHCPLGRRRVGQQPSAGPCPLGCSSHPGSGCYKRGGGRRASLSCFVSSSSPRLRLVPCLTSHPSRRPRSWSSSAPLSPHSPSSPPRRPRSSRPFPRPSASRAPSPRSTTPTAPSTRPPCSATSPRRSPSSRRGTSTTRPPRRRSPRRRARSASSPRSATPLRPRSRSTVPSVAARMCVSSLLDRARRPPAG